MGSRSMTGLIIQPIIGYFSDRTWKLGTKKTLLLAGAILASAALFIMPNSPTYGLQQECYGLWMLPSFLWSHFVFCWR
jgi:MFS family permease